MIHKYLSSDSVEYWIRNPKKSHARGSMIWKVVVQSFSFLESNLAWKVGDGRKLRVSEDPWVDSAQKHILPSHMVEEMRERETFSTSTNLQPLFRIIYGFTHGDHLLLLG